MVRTRWVRAKIWAGDARATGAWLSAPWACGGRSGLKQGRDVMSRASRWGTLGLRRPLRAEATELRSAKLAYAGWDVQATRAQAAPAAMVAAVHDWKPLSYGFGLDQPRPCWGRSGPRTRRHQ